MNEDEYTKGRLEDQIGWYEKKSRWYKQFHMTLRIIEIIAAAAIPFIATFAVYGPILLLRQATNSGARGRFWLLHFPIVFGPAVMVCGILILTGHDHLARATVFPILLAGIVSAAVLQHPRRPVSR